MSHKQSLLSIHQQSDDQTIGQTIVRLATLAMSVHRCETALESSDSFHAEEPLWVEGINPKAVASSACTDAGYPCKPVCTEVDR